MIGPSCIEKCTDYPCNEDHLLKLGHCKLSLARVSIIENLLLLPVCQKGDAIHVLLPAGGELFSRSSVLSSIPAKDKLAPGYYHRYALKQCYTNSRSEWCTCCIFIFDSFGLTENYIVFMEQPLKIELRKYHMLILLGKPFSGMLNWKPEENVSYYSL